MKPTIMCSMFYPMKSSEQKCNHFSWLKSEKHEKVKLPELGMLCQKQEMNIFTTNTFSWSVRGGSHLEINRQREIKRVKRARERNTLNG